MSLDRRSFLKFLPFAPAAAKVAVESVNKPPKFTWWPDAEWDSAGMIGHIDQYRFNKWYESFLTPHRRGPFLERWRNATGIYDEAVYRFDPPIPSARDIFRRLDDSLDVRGVE